MVLNECYYIHLLIDRKEVEQAFLDYLEDPYEVIAAALHFQVDVERTANHSRQMGRELVVIVNHRVEVEVRYKDDRPIVLERSIDQRRSILIHHLGFREPRGSAGPCR